MTAQVRSIDALGSHDMLNAIYSNAIIRSVGMYRPVRSMVVVWCPVLFSLHIVGTASFMSLVQVEQARSGISALAAAQATIKQLQDNFMLIEQ